MYAPSGRRRSRSTSTDTPRKLVPSFDHLVTQWMSQGTLSRGSSWNSSQLHSRSAPTIPSIRSDHSVVSTVGVGPAVRTGKPRSKYCPGGSLSASSSGARRRPLKPREMKLATARAAYPVDLRMHQLEGGAGHSLRRPAPFPRAAGSGRPPRGGCRASRRQRESGSDRPARPRRSGERGARGPSERTTMSSRTFVSDSAGRSDTPTPAAIRPCTTL